MSARTVFMVASATREAAWQASSLAVTACALGDEVTIAFSFAALDGLVDGSFGAGNWPAGVSPSVMLRQARDLGARFVACETVVAMSGLEPSALVPRILDTVIGLPELWRLCANARVLSF